MNFDDSTEHALGLEGQLSGSRVSLARWIQQDAARLVNKCFMAIAAGSPAPDLKSSKTKERNIFEFATHCVAQPLEVQAGDQSPERVPKAKNTL